MKLIWSDRALSQLEKIHAYLLEEATAEATRTVLTRLVESAEQLRELPSLGRRVPEPGFEEYRELVVDRYLVVYRVQGERLEISGVHHGAQDRARVLEDLLSS